MIPLEKDNKLNLKLGETALVVPEAVRVRLPQEYKDAR